MKITFLVLLATLSLNIQARMVEENLDEAFDYSYQKPIHSERKLAGKQEKKKEEKKRDVASDEIATDTDVKYWKYTP